MTKATKQQRKPLWPKAPGLQILVGWQYNGGVYGLDPWSEDKIQEAFPEARMIEDGMLLGYNETRDYERFHKPHFEQIAQMLTGLSPEQIGRLGGIRIYDTEAKKVLWTWRPPAANGE